MTCHTCHSLCTALQGPAVQCKALHCTARPCSAVHAVQCRAIYPEHCGAVSYSFTCNSLCTALQGPAGQCSAVQRHVPRVMQYCSIVQWSVMYRSSGRYHTVQCIVAQCSEIQWLQWFVVNTSWVQYSALNWTMTKLLLLGRVVFVFSKPDFIPVLPTMSLGCSLPLNGQLANPTRPESVSPVCNFFKVWLATF